MMLSAIGASAAATSSQPGRSNLPRSCATRTLESIRTATRSLDRVYFLHESRPRHRARKLRPRRVTSLAIRECDGRVPRHSSLCPLRQAAPTVPRPCLLLRVQTFPQQTPVQKAPGAFRRPHLWVCASCRLQSNRPLANVQLGIHGVPLNNSSACLRAASVCPPSMRANSVTRCLSLRRVIVEMVRPFSTRLSTR